MRYICNQIRLLSHIIVEIKYSSSICTIIELSTSVNMNRVGKLCSVGMFKAFLRAKLRIGLPATDIWGRTGSFRYLCSTAGKDVDSKMSSAGTYSDSNDNLGEVPGVKRAETNSFWCTLVRYVRPEAPRKSPNAAMRRELW